MKTKGFILIQRDANKWPGILESSLNSALKCEACEKPLSLGGINQIMFLTRFKIKKPLKA